MSVLECFRYFANRLDKSENHQERHCELECNQCWNEELDQ